MGKQETVFDWQTMEEDAAWPPPNGRTPPATARRLTRGRQWWALGIAVACLLVVLGEGYREVRQAEQTMTRVENEVAAAVVADAWVEQQHREQDDGDRARQKDGGLARNSYSSVEARRVEVRDGYAMVELWTTVSEMPWLPAPYRETRFYQESAQGWLPVAPPDAFYRPLATLQAGRFTFVYGPRDAEAVGAAAQQIERVEQELRQELGLPVSDAALTVKVVTGFARNVEAMEETGVCQGAICYVASPALLPLPAQVTEGDALVQMVAGLLVDREVDEALADSPEACQWRSLARGLRLWLRWEQNRMPSQRRYEIQRLLEFKVSHGTLPYLTWLAPDHNACALDSNKIDLAGSYTNDWVAPVFVEYAVRAYGRDTVRGLIEGMARDESWEELIPAVYGVSAAEFEAGWRGGF